MDIRNPLPVSNEIDVRGEICKIISRMLDNPNEYGIYPTTRCFDELEAFIKSYTEVVKGISSAALDREGWVMVPRGMTEEMLLAGCTAVQDIYAKEGGWCGLKAAQDQVAATWNAMIFSAIAKARGAQS